MMMMMKMDQVVVNPATAIKSLSKSGVETHDMALKWVR